MTLGKVLVPKFENMVQTIDVGHFVWKEQSIRIGLTSDENQVYLKVVLAGIFVAAIRGPLASAQRKEGGNTVSVSTRLDAVGFSDPPSEKQIILFHQCTSYYNR